MTMWLKPISEILKNKEIINKQNANKPTVKLHYLKELDGTV